MAEENSANENIEENQETEDNGQIPAPETEEDAENTQPQTGGQVEIMRNGENDIIAASVVTGAVMGGTAGCLLKGGLLAIAGGAAAGAAIGALIGCACVSLSDEELLDILEKRQQAATA